MILVEIGVFIQELFKSNFFGVENRIELENDDFWHFGKFVVVLEAEVARVQVEPAGEALVEGHVVQRLDVQVQTPLRMHVHLKLCRFRPRLKVWVIIIYNKLKNQS